MAIRFPMVATIAGMTSLILLAFASQLQPAVISIGGALVWLGPIVHGFVALVALLAGRTWWRLLVFLTGMAHAAGAAAA